MPEVVSVKVDISEDVRTLARLTKRIRKVYTTTVNTSETIERNVKAFVQPPLEMRYAWEHFSDAILDANEEWNAAPELIKAELTETRGHLLRCYTDTTEWRFLLIKIFTNEMTKRLNIGEIESAIPRFYADIFPLYNIIEKTIVQLKDDAPECTFETRINLLDQANAHCETILEALNETSLKELNRRSARGKLVKALGVIGTAAVGGLITLLIQYLSQLLA